MLRAVSLLFRSIATRKHKIYLSILVFYNRRLFTLSFPPPLSQAASTNGCSMHVCFLFCVICIPQNILDEIPGQPLRSPPFSLFSLSN